jgi:hypothetical protein
VLALKTLEFPDEQEADNRRFKLFQWAQAKFWRQCQNIRKLNIGYPVVGNSHPT